jgi:succinylarginine dihydrolase
MPAAHEVNFDGLVGPTHNYAGLSRGNLASHRHRHAVSNPRQAALEGLAKMKFMADLGIPQAVLPPQERPDLRTLRRLGFCGSDGQVLERAAREAPAVFASCFSASSMWAANAATVSPVGDTCDGRVHFTPANLVSQFHRSLEASSTTAILRAIFRDEGAFALHDPLPSSPHLSDEGAANHMRMARSHADRGIEVFVYGRSAFDSVGSMPTRFPARQTREASEAIARLHGLDAARTIFVLQNPAAIDAGAFHNDVVAVANENVLFYHAAAFANAPLAAQQIRQSFEKLSASQPTLIEVSEQQVPLADAVRSYLFNSQLVTLADQTMALICPIECRETASTAAFLQALRDRPGHAIRTIHFVDVRQSMNNGGGPACLRLRVVLDSDQMAKVEQGVLFTPALHQKLEAWIGRHYREKLAPEDLSDVKLVDESRAALDELTHILNLGSIYPCQRASL